MHLHKNVRLTAITREELVRSVVQDFLPLSAAAAEFNVSVHDRCQVGPSLSAGRDVRVCLTGPLGRTAPATVVSRAQ